MAKLTTVRLEEINKAYWANLSHIEVRELLFHIFEIEKEFSAALREAVASEREECAKLCDDERLRQIKGDRFDRMNGQDTAFGLSQAIRARAEQGGRG